MNQIKKGKKQIYLVNGGNAMSGYTENKIVIYRDYNHVFDLSNRVDLWPRLFTEYETSEVLIQKDNYVKFRLTTFPEADRASRSWISERKIKKQEALAEATRLDPIFPFSYMRIRWEYEKLPNDIGVVMTWIQDFDVHPDCKVSVEKMESFLNNNTRIQMNSVKKNIESWVGEF